MDLASLHREIVESSPDGIWVTDPEGRTLYANEAFARLYGVPLAEVTSVTVFDTLDDVGRQQYVEHVREVRAGRPNDDEVEVYFVDVHGRSQWISLRESPMFEDGELVALVSRVYPYDRRRRALEELTASRKAVQEAQDLARLGTWRYELATKRLELLGGAALGVPIDAEPAADQLLALVHPDDRSRVESTMREALTRAGELEFDVRLASGATWVHLRVRGLVHLADDGTPASVTGSHQDVTEMRLAELALRDEVVQGALMRQVAAAANAAHTLTEVLGIVRPLLGAHDDWVRSAAFRVDEAGHLTAIDDDITRAEESLCRAALRSPAPVWSDDGRTIAFRVGQPGRTFAVGTVTSSQPLERRDVVEVMVEAVAVQLARVAEREETGGALAAARDAAMAASRQKSEFLATMSHEIRTPLNGIIGLTDLLQRTVLDHDQQRLASGMQAAGHTLLTVLNDVLDFSKVDGRVVELERVDVDVRSLVDQVVRVLSGAARTGGVELIVWCEAPVPALVLGDPTRLSQVLMNLVSNAVKFSSGGEVLVRVSTTDVDGDRVRLKFAVSDTGIGVEPEQLERLFEPFTQADASTTRRFGGTGLGLSIARKIVSALGGEIAFAHNPGGGSIFSFEVWFDPHPEGATDLDDYARTWLTGRRVLVADGSALRVPALRDQLRWWQVEVDVADDVARAGELLARSLSLEKPYEAVLIDARVAGGGGMVLVGEIAGDSAYDRVAMIVIGSDLEVDLRRLREAGVSVFLERPVSSETLRGTLLEQLVGVPSQPMGRAEVIAHGSDAPRILVVEDNVVNQLVAGGLLASLGYRTDIADNGAEALEKLARETYDAVLMDVQMPVLDGYAATRTLREREAADTHMPVIAMTAAAIAGERERCLAAGMDEFLTKPVDRAALAHALDRWIVRRADPAGPSAPAPGSTQPGSAQPGSTQPGSAQPGSTQPTTATPEPAPAPPPALPPTGPMPGLDTARLDMLRDLDPGDTTYIDRAIGNFQTNSAASEATIADLAAAGEALELKAVAHKIAGSALNLGVTRAGEAARAIEQLADTGTTRGADELLAELHAAMAEARERLLAYRASYHS